MLGGDGQHLYCGSCGAGPAGLTNNLILHGRGEASEAMVLGPRRGSTWPALHDLLMDASAGSKALGMRQGALVGNFEPGFTIDNMQKDGPLGGAWPASWGCAC